MKVIYEDEDILALDKPAGIISDEFPNRVHRLDKDTSGVFLLAKKEKALEFLQKQFKARRVEKKYIALSFGCFKNDSGTIETLIGRSPNDRRKQKTFSLLEPKSQNKRTAITKYKVIKRFDAYTLVEAMPKTGRKHQIRAHLAHIGHPIAGDKLYGFKNQPATEGLQRQFLHACQLKIKTPSGKIKEFLSELPIDLKKILEKLKTNQNEK